MSERAGGWLTLEEAAAELKVPADAVRALVACGQLAAADVGQEARIPAASLRGYASRAERRALGRRLTGGRQLAAVAAAALLLAGAGVIAAGAPGPGEVVPRQIPYRGTLNLDGLPVTSTATQMVFSLYTSEAD